MNNISFLTYNDKCFVPIALNFMLLLFNGLKSVVYILFEPAGSFYKEGYILMGNRILPAFIITKLTGQGAELGLSLSYDIVKAHGGELNLETKEGEGCTFSITLPLN